MKAVLVVFACLCMSRVGLLICVVMIVAQSCEDNEYSIRVEKCSKTYANEESYRILYNNLLLIQSEAFTNNACRYYYHCLPKKPTGKYTLRMLDRYGLGFCSSVARMMLGRLARMSEFLDPTVSWRTLVRWWRSLRRITTSTVGVLVAVERSGIWY